MNQPLFITTLLSITLLTACSSKVEKASEYIVCQKSAEGLHQDTAQEGMLNTYNEAFYRNDDTMLDAKEYIDAVYLAMGKIGNVKQDNDKMTYLKIYNSNFCQDMHREGKLTEKAVSDIIPIDQLPLPRRY